MISRWSKERVEATVTPDYVARRLGPKKQSALLQALLFGRGLTNDTYLDWIVTRSRKIFLILDDIGCPDHIFESVDKSFDDEDLPLTAEAIDELGLGRVGYGKKFAQRQHAFLVQDLHEASHVDFAHDEIVPVDVSPRNKIVQSSPNVDRVRVGDKTYLRRRLSLDPKTGIEKMHFILHFRSLQRLKHPHLTSVWATYTHRNFGYVLLHPSSELTLKAFLEDPPKHFKSLTKPQQREIVINWIQCLANALAYLHENGYAHQAIRPSNVFVDEKYNIYLGAHGALGALEDKGEPAYEKEAYNHAAPEQWQKRATVAETNPLRSTLQGGGRTGRRIKPASSSGSSSSSTVAPSLKHFPRGTPSETPNGSVMECTTMDQTPGHRTSTVSSQSTAPTSYTASSASSGLIGRAKGPRGRTLISTLTYSQPNPSKILFDASPYYPSDVFSMCTVITLLLSLLASISRTGSKFSPSNISAHLGKKNRNAGRGGAPADCSWHSNLGQVAAWLDTLEDSAKEKPAGILNLGRKGKASKEGESETWRWQGFLGGTTYLMRRGFSRNAEDRWTATDAVNDIKKAQKLWGIPPSMCCETGPSPTGSSTHSIPETPIPGEEFSFASMRAERPIPPTERFQSWDYKPPSDYKPPGTYKGQDESGHGVSIAESVYEGYQETLADVESVIHVDLDDWPAPVASPVSLTGLPLRSPPPRGPLPMRPPVRSTVRSSGWPVREASKTTGARRNPSLVEHG